MWIRFHTYCSIRHVLPDEFRYTVFQACKATDANEFASTLRNMAHSTHVRFKGCEQGPRLEGAQVLVLRLSGDSVKRLKG